MSRRHNANHSTLSIPLSGAIVPTPSTSHNHLGMISHNKRLSLRTRLVLFLLGLALATSIFSILYNLRHPSLSPTIQFVGDKVLADVNPNELSDGCSAPKQHDNDHKSFGMPLVASWRSFPPEMELGYERLVTRIQPLFASTSGFYIMGDDMSKIDCINPEAHIYPFKDMHITVATFRTKNDKLPAKREDVEAIKQFSKDVLQKASRRPDWPEEGSKLRIQPLAIKLGNKNAIILWNEMTGNMDRMRGCIQKEMEAARSQITDVTFKGMIDSSLASYDIPPIVHSTFIRFWRKPSNPEILMHTFNEERLVDVIPAEFEVGTDSVQLIYEDTICMHIDREEDHVLWKAD